ncbi:MAG: DsrE family protein [Acidimicrobiales bacterium]|nr:DsrE family protein [Acidimicrobiales bacterium]
MDRRKLIFFVGANPATDPARLSVAYRFAEAAAGAALDTEVRLAGDAVLAADPAFIATVDGTDALRQRIDRAARNHVDVSVCPYSTEARGINDEQVAAIGARPRLLSDILVEVAEGRSVLVHVG